MGYLFLYMRLIYNSTPSIQCGTFDIDFMSTFIILTAALTFILCKYKHSYFRIEIQYGTITQLIELPPHSFSNTNLILTASMEPENSVTVHFLCVIQFPHTFQRHAVWQVN